MQQLQINELGPGTGGAGYHLKGCLLSVIACDLVPWTVKLLAQTSSETFSLNPPMNQNDGAIPGAQLHRGSNGTMSQVIGLAAWCFSFPA
jgi:hypothetical protein